MGRHARSKNNKRHTAEGFAQALRAHAARVSERELERQLGLRPQPEWFWAVLPRPNNRPPQRAAHLWLARSYTVNGELCVPLCGWGGISSYRNALEPVVFTLPLAGHELVCSTCRHKFIGGACG